MADPAQHKRETAYGLADQWCHGGAICLKVSATASWRLRPLLGPYPKAYTAPLFRSVRRAPGRLDHRPVHIVTSFDYRNVPCNYLNILGFFRFVQVQGNSPGLRIDRIDTAIVLHLPCEVHDLRPSFWAKKERPLSPFLAFRSAPLAEREFPVLVW